MAPLKRGPKAKSKNVVKVEENFEVTACQACDDRATFRREDRVRQVWFLAANLLEAKVKQSATVHPAAIVELASYAKQLANEVYGPE
mgnify:CR=1 FL=1